MKFDKLSENNQVFLKVTFKFQLNEVIKFLY